MRFIAPNDEGVLYDRIVDRQDWERRTKGKKWARPRSVTSPTLLPFHSITDDAVIIDDLKKR